MLRSIKAYESKIILFTSIKLFLEGKGLQAFVENKIERPGRTPDEPDLFVKGGGYTFIEEKGSLPSDKEMLRRELEDVRAYATLHVFEGASFTPDVVLLCPDDVYQSNRASISSDPKLTVVTYPFPVEDPIVTSLVQGGISDGRLRPVFEGSEPISHARSIMPTIKFLRHDPPVPYSAWTIWQVIWDSAPVSREDFKVTYPAIIQQCRKFYPGWMSRDIEQVTQGRLNDSLELLRYLGWVDFQGSPHSPQAITVHYARGDKIRSTTLEYFSKKHLEMRSKATRKTLKLSMRGIRRIKPSGKDSSLTDFMK